MTNFTEISNFIEIDVINQKDNRIFNSYLYEIPNFDFFGLISCLNQTDYFFWKNPETNLTFIGLGRTSLNIFGKTGKDFSVNNVFDNLKSLIRQNYDTPNIPLVCGGIKFSDKKSGLWEDFSYTDFFIPQVILIKRKDAVNLVVNVNQSELASILSILKKLNVFSSNSIKSKADKIKAQIVFDEPIDVWNNKINYALNKIQTSHITKVVLARQKTIKLINSADIKTEACFFNTLSKNHNDATIYGYKKNSVLFFGASPEKFLSIHNNCLETDALAGSSLIKSECDKFDNELLRDKKNIYEHNQVLDYIINGLQDITDEVKYEKSPQIKNLTYIQHLWTPIKAKLNPEANVLKVIEKLFPTPAVCGFPKDRAYKIINDIENDDRGMYAGLIGWFNLTGDSELYVSLRSALLKENFLHAFAGCGIVEGSDAIKEYSETDSKFIPILNLVDIEN